MEYKVFPICEYFNNVALCRHHLKEDGTFDEQILSFCEISPHKCDQYMLNKELEARLIEIHGEKEGLRKARELINSEARRKDFLDGVVK